jgi:phosphohistidine phosphatase SixA
LLRPQHHGKANRHAGGQADQQAHLTQHGHLGEVFQERQAEQRRLAVYRVALAGTLSATASAMTQSRP